MYQQGHYGVSLVVFAPVGFALVRLGRGDLAFVVGAAMVGLATLPDVDHSVPGLSHRGPTHSLVFAALVGGVFAAVGEVLAGAGVVDATAVAVVGSVPLFGFLVGFLAVLAHLLGDVITPMGVNFLWPLSRRRYSLSLCRADNRPANYALFAAGVFVASAAVYLALTL